MGSIWFRSLGVANDCLENALSRLGSFVGQRKDLTILLTLGVVLVSWPGFLTLSFETRPEKLWLPGDSMIASDRNTRDTFPSFEYENYIEIGPSSSNFFTLEMKDGSDIVSNGKAALQKMLDLWQLSYQRQHAQPSCGFRGNSVLGYFKNNASLDLGNISNVQFNQIQQMLECPRFIPDHGNITAVLNSMSKVDVSSR